ncbi:nucleoside-diphosphate kinase [Patescibacteria group bacterium]|nr:nucleoside-diphosphate kinase [Patescibacteria group bacterium]
MTSTIERLKATSQGLTEFSRRPRDKFIPVIGEQEARLKENLAVLEREKISLIAEILNDPELHNLIDQGRITFAMIRPNLQLGQRTNLPDPEIEVLIKDRIKQQFEIVFELPVVFSADAASEFYNDVKPALAELLIPQGAPRCGDALTYWDSFLNVITGGKTTILLLFDKDANDHDDYDNAVTRWRGLMGPTLPDPQRDRGTLRGDFGNRINNIVHGSDSINSVRREVLWLADKIGQTIGV